MPTGIAPTSVDVIAQHRLREALAVREGRDAEAADVLARIVAFLSSRAGHTATSDVLLDTFAADAEKQRGALFKQTLRQVATLKKGPGQAEWVLKADFL
jgi:hypothetical protein